MMTEELISKLVAEAKPVPCRAMEMRLGKGILIGAVFTLVLVVLLLGIRPDISAASMSAVFWIKIAYGGAYAAIGVMFLRQLARPCTRAIKGVALLAIPTALLSLLVANELLAAWRTGDASALAFASGWSCTLLIVALSIPLMAGIVWAFGEFAPSKLKAAGAAAGLTAGGLAAVFYSLYCVEVSATYLWTRYTVALAATSMIGALAGPRLFRW